MWPIALANIVREGDDDTIWARLHARQALVFGILASLLFFVVLAFPLATVVAIPALSTSATIVVYALGFMIDVFVAVALALLGLRFSARAARGELFSIPLVTPIVDTWFPVKRT